MQKKTHELSSQVLRAQIRQGAHKGNTSGLAAGFVQGNIVILPQDWANEFLQFCQLNPKPCPLIGMSSNAGDFFCLVWEKMSIYVPMCRNIAFLSKVKSAKK